MEAAATNTMPYYLGLPAWAFAGWQGEYFPPGGSALSHYCEVFNTVEGNTTFYRVPERQTIARWRDAVAGTGFRFSFKLPRSITHERRPDWKALGEFMAGMELLEANLGPFLVQCPARMGPAELPGLEKLFAALPREHRYALEVRHPDFFAEPALLEPLLERSGAARVMFDSRPIYREDATHPEVLAARHKKPDVPLLDEVYNGIVYARVVLHPEASLNPPYVAEWVDRLRRYLERGDEVYFMMHCPNNQHCPGFAELFHGELRRAMPSMPPLPPWPVPRQAGLF